MLILARELMECIRIGETIVGTVLKFLGNKVRLGIDAPGAVRVIRAELPDRTPEGSDGGMPSTAWPER